MRLSNKTSNQTKPNQTKQNRKNMEKTSKSERGKGHEKGNETVKIQKPLQKSIQQSPGSAPPPTLHSVPHSASHSTKIFAIVRMRGVVRIAPGIEETLTKLNIRRVNYCTLIRDAPNLHGMLQKAKDYITWGEASPDLIKALEKKAEPDPRDPKKKKPFFRLNPPRGGYGRKGIKTSFNQSGASGYRGEKINHLIQRMLM